MIRETTLRTKKGKKGRYFHLCLPLEPRLLLDAALLDPHTQPQFVNPLPIPAVIQPTVPGGTHYDVSISQFTQNLGLVDPATGAPLSTTVWGYNGSYPGPTFVVQQNQPVTVTWYNDLVDASGNPLPHLFPIDTSICHADSSTGVPVVTHLHGGHSESASDGLPEQWYTPGWAETGPDFVKETFFYSNDQQPATIWYHDHALGHTRQNVYAGLAGFYLIRNKDYDKLKLPSGDYEMGLAIQDRLFTADGQLYYPTDTASIEITDPSLLPDPNVSIHPEMFGDTILVNGMAWPVLDVEPRKYLFHLLNGSDSRFYNLTLSSGQQFLQIGTDQGLLNDTLASGNILIAPGERFDVVVDFSDPALAGQTIIMNNDAAGPFPNGDPVDPETTGRIMAFRVSQPLQGKDKSVVPDKLRKNKDLITPLGASDQTRQLLLWETQDEYGRLLPILGTAAQGAIRFMDPITENPALNSVETWEIYNTTMDTHPIHLHLVAFQITSRQQFTALQDPATGALSNITLVGDPYAANPFEAGWKDTVQVNPSMEMGTTADGKIIIHGEVTRVQARFDRPGLYVWHCHILSHEEHDMMRYYYVGPMPPPMPMVETAAAGTTLASSAAVEFLIASDSDDALTPIAPHTTVANLRVGLVATPTARPRQSTLPGDPSDLIQDPALPQVDLLLP